MSDPDQHVCALCGRVGQFGFGLFVGDRPDVASAPQFSLAEDGGREWVCTGRSREACKHRQWMQGFRPV